MAFIQFVEEWFEPLAGGTLGLLSRAGFRANILFSKGMVMDNSTITRQRPRADRQVRPELVVLHSPDPRFPAGGIVALTDRRVLGRSAGQRGVDIEDQAISRSHVRIQWHARPGMAELTDLNSKNGTMVNGLLTQRRYLELQDVLRIGDTLFVVRESKRDGTLLQPTQDVLPYIVGASLPACTSRQELLHMAPASLPVLILGQTGTGKELAARALHEKSGRSGQFLVVNCGAVPENLFESTLFGHRKGAFTGAHEDSAGLLRECHRGTLFLDEVGELSPACQPKLLRFLEDGLVRSVGSTSQEKVEVRVVAATNAPVFEMERNGKFRSDLLGRLAGLTVELPPLCDRREDIPALLAYFIREAGVPDFSVQSDALEALLCATWPRNIRELRSLAYRFVQVVWARDQKHKTGPVIRLMDLPDHIKAPVVERQRAAVPPRLPDTVRPSKGELQAAIDSHEGNLQRVAEMFGRDRKQIYRWMERYGIGR